MRVRVRGGARVGRWVISLVVVSVLAGCADDAVSPATGEGALLATPFQTLADAAAGDVAVVFRVVAEREFGDGDIAQRHDGVPPTSPAPDPSDDEYVGRVVRVLVDEVVWTSGDREVPTELDLVTAGWVVDDRNRIVDADEGPWFRVQVGGRYFGVFADLDGTIAPLAVNSVYGLDGDRLVEVSSDGGPDELDGATLTDVADLLAAPPPAAPAVPSTAGGDLPVRTEPP